MSQQSMATMFPACGLTTADADEALMVLRAQGRTYREIGKVLGISMSRARQRHCDAERRGRTVIVEIYSWMND